MSARFIVGDSLAVVRSLPDASVDLVLTSPPFLALRSYLPADHPDKHLEIGSESTPGAFIDTLLTHTEEWRRVLAPHGSICVELGDTYSGSGGAGGDYTPDGLRAAQPAFTGSAYARRVEALMPRTGPGRTTAERAGWPLDKSLCLIPELYRVALVYGFNPLTGRTTQRWRGRNVVRWCRPNPPVGALGDKVRPATSDMVVACTSRKRYFDLEVVRVVNNPDRMVRDSGSSMPKYRDYEGKGSGDGDWNPAGAPPLDHWWFDEFDQDAWLIPTAPYKGAHYATWPPDLCVRPILAMCPQKVCRTCGKPSERITGDVSYTRDGAEVAEISDWPWGGVEVGKSRQGRGDDYRLTRQAETVGWTDCGHDDWRPGVVLDPFAGSGTTLAVATGHGRDAIGIDLDARNADLALERCGMFLEVEYAEAVA